MSKEQIALEESQAALDNLPEDGKLATIIKPNFWYTRFVGKQIVVVPHKFLTDMCVLYPTEFMVSKYDLVWDKEIRESKLDLPPLEDQPFCFYQDDGYFYRIAHLGWDQELGELVSAERWKNGKWKSLSSTINKLEILQEALNDPSGIRILLKGDKIILSSTLVVIVSILIILIYSYFR